MATKAGSRRKASDLLEKFDVGRGTIQISILGLLKREDMCGYQIAKTLRETSDALKIQYGVLYPLLERMESDGLIKGRWEDGRGQNGLHVYKMTPAGHKALERSQATWLRLVRQVRTLVGAGV